jgi:Flp pilus assembly protein TadG
MPSCIRKMTPKARARSLLKRGWKETRAAELVEMAFVIPLLLTLLIGIFWAARAYNIYETITRAAREGARAAVTPTCSTCGDAFPASTTVSTAVTNSLAASGMQTSGTGITITVQQHQQLNLDANNPSALWTVVTVTYPFQFALPFTSINASTVSMTTTSQMVEEQ